MMAQGGFGVSEQKAEYAVESVGWDTFTTPAMGMVSVAYADELLAKLNLALEASSIAEAERLKLENVLRNLVLQGHSRSAEILAALNPTRAEA